MVKVTGKVRYADKSGYFKVNEDFNFIPNFWLLLRSQNKPTS